MSDDNESTLNKFLLPEKEVSLKVVFDNLRNYVIVGAFFGMARWFEQDKATAPPGIFTGPPRSGWMTYAWLCLVVACVLFLLNAGQTYSIVARVWNRVFRPVSSEPGSQRKLPWYVYFISYLMALAATAVIITTAFMLLNLVIYIVWYAAVGAGR